MEIYGKKDLKSYFASLVKTKSFGQFYIFEGADGVGKKTFSDFLAAAIHCEGDIKPCGVCSACIKHKTHNHPDYISVENDDKDKDKKNITVDTIRRISHDMYVKPLLSDTKIYVLGDEKPLAPEGQNAFLKILEEPPSFVLILMLVKNRASLLSTVLSRGIVRRVDPCTHDETLEYLRRFYPSLGERAELIASFSGGVIGNAKSLAEEDSFFSLRDDFYKTLSVFPENQTGALRDTVSFILKYKDNWDDIINLLFSWLRDVIFLKTADEGSVINFDFKDNISAFASVIPTDKVIKTADEAESMANLYSKGNNLELWAFNVLKNLL